MKVSHTISGHHSSIKFSEKPDAAIRSMLKAYGMRWSPSSGEWWKRGCSGMADLLGAIDRKLNPGRPDGDCWTCGEPGTFRNEGAACPVRCDECQKEAMRLRREQEAKGRHNEDPLGVDTLWEDSCRSACGL